MRFAIASILILATFATPTTGTAEEHVDCTLHPYGGETGPVCAHLFYVSTKSLTGGNCHRNPADPPGIYCHEIYKTGKHTCTYPIVCSGELHKDGYTHLYPDDTCTAIGLRIPGELQQCGTSLGVAYKLGSASIDCGTHVAITRSQFDIIVPHGTIPGGPDTVAWIEAAFTCA